MSKFLPISAFKWIDHNEFGLNEYNSNSTKGCVLEFDLEYPKEVHELYSDYPLSADKEKSKEKYF